jgi:type II secretory pathway predicted ATPase ExeA
MYTEFFGLHEKPFSITPDPRYLFMSERHGEGLAHLVYGVQESSGFIQLTGEVGTGKTTLIHALLSKTDANVTLGLISNAQGDRGDLLRWVLNALDVPLPDETDYVSLFQHFQTFVIDEYAAGRHVVLIIDEAQNLGTDMLEELRMFTNINSGRDVLLQIVLIGQPELRTIITQPELRQFAQRVTVTFDIKPFDLRETRAYVRHRLQHAGGDGTEITPAVVRAIFEESDGIPRIINRLCDLALVYAAGAGRKKVGLGVIRELFNDGVILKPLPPPLYLTNRVDIAQKAAE